MNSDTTFKRFTAAASATQQLGRAIGRLMKKGMAIELVGDIGSGKTTLAQGIISGLGYAGEVPSPTFTVGRVYPISGGRQAYHFDFYRLAGRDAASEELADALADPQAVVVAEWPRQGEIRLPVSRLRITITPQAAENQRQVIVEDLGAKAADIMEGLRRVYRD